MLDASDLPGDARSVGDILRERRQDALTAKAKDAECFETLEWAVRSILHVELLTQRVWDPCCGPGVLAKAARDAGYDVAATDLHDWGFGSTGRNFLDTDYPLGFDQGHDFSILMNPPFTLAVDFVMRAFELGARKIVCFQRASWWESRTRRDFWRETPPSRVYYCGDRATCWRADVPEAERAGRSVPTAHAWFVWERGHPPGTTLGHIWKDTPTHV